MQPFLRALTGRWVLTAFGLLSASLMLWLYGPVLSSLDGVMPRVLAMLVMSFVWMAGNLAVDMSRRRLDRQLAAGVTAGTAPAAKTAVGAEDIAEQRDRLTHAMTLLRQAKGTRGYLYEQPWYAIIGPPGSGKTTALANAGLRFPLAAELGGAEVRGVGGTRFCDWSFTDEAVLIDTAGRYTTQDSDAATDKAGWDGFLALLKRTRPRQPLNGVIVAISVTEVATASPSDRLAHARAVRSRIKELYSGLSLRMPVYLVFTKLDLIQGFTDFFDHMDRERRAQVWGVTFPLVNDPLGPAGLFRDEFHALTTQLSARVVDLLQAERSPERRAAIADFPVQFATLEAPLAAFVDEAFMGTRLEPAPVLRGVYLASGTQEGSVIDRLTGTVARMFGIDQRRAAPLRPSGRGYFLETLMKRVVFGEAMLVVANPRLVRRRRILRLVAWGTSAMLLAVGLGALSYAAIEVGGHEKAFESMIAEYRRSVDSVTLSPVIVGAPDLPDIVRVLNQARKLVAEVGTDSAGLRLAAMLHLSQREKHVEIARNLYRKAQELILLPRLVSSAEAAMAGQAGNLDGLYRATRIYLILCARGPMDKPMVRDWFQTAWAQTYSSASLASLRTDLLAHLDELLAHPLNQKINPDSDLLARSQARLANIGVAERAYAMLRTSASVQVLRPFVPAEVSGARAAYHFVRSSGRPMEEPIPGVFTAAGFNGAIIPGMANATDRAIRESWVLGRASELDSRDPASRQRVERDVLALYARDYRAVWNALLVDIDVVPPADAKAAPVELSLMASPQGPLKLLISAIVRELDLTARPDTAKPGDAGPAVDPSIRGLNDHFRDLREYVQGGQIDVALKAIEGLQRQIENQLAANATGAGAPTPGMDAAQTLRRSAESSPAPISRWLQTLAVRGGNVRDDATRQQAAAAYAGPAGAGPLCNAVMTRFPFRPAARDDLALSDFAELFAPNGRFDTFYAQFVRPYVDTSGKDWRLRDPSNPQVPVTPEALGQFQRAQAIRDAFFSGGGTQPRIDFAVYPGSVDLGAYGVVLDFGGIPVRWSRGSIAGAKQITWPGPTRMLSVSASFDPPGDGPPIRTTGPWALFRLLKDAPPERVRGADAYMVTLRQGEREARFDLTTNMDRSPFDPELLGRFRCPALR